MFGGKLHRKVSQIDETYGIEDSAVLAEKVGRKARGEPAFGDTIFAVRRIAECIRTVRPANESSRESARSAGRRANRDRDFEMLAASICCNVYYTMLPSKKKTSQVPRCLFGKPCPRETMEMCQEALDLERSRFKSRWGVDPLCSEDKENNYRRRGNEKNEHSPSKKRNNPYSRQTNIHDYWRARKMCEVNKKPLTTTTEPLSKQQNVESSKPAKTITTMAANTTTKMTSN